MTLRKGAPHATQRWMLLIAAVGAWTLIMAGLALATLPGTTFEGNDGNLIAQTGTDWSSFSPPTLHLGYDTPSGSTDNAFGKGTKEDDPNVSVVDGSIPPNKNDLTRFYEVSQQVANGDVMLYLAWERAVNIGNANLDFEINKNPTTGFDASFTGDITLDRTPGDLLVTYDFGGSGAPTLGLNYWLTSATVPSIAGFTTNVCLSAHSFPCWGDHVDLGGTIAEGAVNDVVVSDPLGSDAPRPLPVGTFGEAAINLTTAGVFQPGVCEAFGSTFLKSRSSSSFTSEIKDFIAPTPVDISNCGTITIHKVTVNDPGSSSFGFTADLSPSSFNLSNGGQEVFSGVQPGDYTISESSVPSADWDLADLTCGTVTGSGTSATTHTDTSTVNITMGIGGNVDCTFTNHYTNSPTISTTLSSSEINIGDSIHDSATLSGATATAGGTVTYTVYTDSSCATEATTGVGGQIDAQPTSGSVSNGSVGDSGSVTFQEPGDYYWQADYSGDTYNDSATSTCSEEHLIVRASPTISTTLSSSEINIGDSIHDSATLSGATATAGGTVTYTVYTDALCTSPAVVGTDINPAQPAAVSVTSGGVPDSASVTFLHAGDFYWQASYSGDTYNDSAKSTCGDEHLVVDKNSPSMITDPSVIPDDSTVLSGATASAGGTIHFYLFDPTHPTCSTLADASYDEAVTVSGNGTYYTTNHLSATPFVASALGTWRWLVTYSGDGDNNATTSACGVESFTISNSAPGS